MNKTSTELLIKTAPDCVHDRQLFLYRWYFNIKYLKKYSLNF